MSDKTMVDNMPLIHLNDSIVLAGGRRREFIKETVDNVLKTDLGSVCAVSRKS